MTTTTAVDLLDALRAHLAGFDLPGLSSVYLVPALPGPQVSIQLTARELPATALALLAWADTLTDEVTAEIWRVPAGDSVHLSVLGRLPEGSTVRVYGAVSCTSHGPGADLDPNTTRALSLAVLRAWATLPEVPTR